MHFASGLKRGRHVVGRDPLLPFFGGERGGAGVAMGAVAGGEAAPAYGRWGEKEEEEAANSVAHAVRAAAKMAASEEPDRGLQADHGLQAMIARRYPRADKIDLAAQGMLKLHVAPDPAAAPAGRSGRGGEAGAPVKVPNGAPLGPVDAGLQGASNGRVAPGGDAAKESKEAEGGAVPPAPEQTKEERAEMVQRALKKYSFYQVRLILCMRTGSFCWLYLAWVVAVFVCWSALSAHVFLCGALCVRTLSPWSFFGRSCRIICRQGLSSRTLSGALVYADKPLAFYAFSRTLTSHAVPLLPQAVFWGSR